MPAQFNMQCFREFKFFCASFFFVYDIEISAILKSSNSSPRRTYKEPMQVPCLHHGAVKKLCMDDHTVKGAKTNCVARHLKTGLLDYSH